MPPSHIQVVLLLLIAVMLVAATYLASIDTSKPTASTSPAPTIRSTLTPIPVPTTATSTSGYWIKIDHISDKQVGDNFMVTAKTNLTVGEIVTVEIHEASDLLVAKAEPRKRIDIKDTSKVFLGTNGENIISYNINSTDFPSDEYLIIESAVNETVTGTSLFNVL